MTIVIDTDQQDATRSIGKGNHLPDNLVGECCFSFEFQLKTFSLGYQLIKLFYFVRVDSDFGVFHRLALQDTKFRHVDKWPRGIVSANSQTPTMCLCARHFFWVIQEFPTVILYTVWAKGKCKVDHDTL